VRAKLAQEIHDLVKVYICQQYAMKGKLPPKFKKCEIIITAYFKHKTRRDVDNLSEKLYLDGLVMAGIIEDDNLNIVVGIHKFAYNDQKEDKVVIEIEEVK
ncbi:MAG: RusA family crossover junction endodeoxyribonuclease, partial [Janthinobacterium sp.]|jgi:Holliday junction resolvase RusA-like endonuclease